MNEATTITVSLAALVSAILTMISAVTAWVTVRMTVKRHAEELLDGKLARERMAARVLLLEEWRHRIRGAQQAQREVSRQDTDRIILPHVDTRSDMHRQSE